MASITIGASCSRPRRSRRCSASAPRPAHQDRKATSRALRNGASNSINQTGQQIVQRQLNIAPTLTIRPGFPVRVIVTRDLVLEPYGG
jgi:type IV secretory pathway VirB10-like protein